MPLPRGADAPGADAGAFIEFPPMEKAWRSILGEIAAGRAVDTPGCLSDWLHDCTGFFIN